jgi:hypothetical protein
VSVATWKAVDQIQSKRISKMKKMPKNFRPGEPEKSIDQYKIWVIPDWTSIADGIDRKIPKTPAKARRMLWM